MIIYKATNIINNKIYIGKTSQTLEKRKWEHYNRAKLGWNQLIYHAIRKYGKNNFLWEVVEETDELHVNEREIFWIKFFNSYIGLPNHNGYNMTTGGEGTSGYKYTLQQRKARSEQLSGKGNPMYGKEITQETREKLKKRKQCGANAKPVLQFDMNNNFIARHNSIIDASIAIGGDASSIVKVCKGKYKHHRGYIWKYEVGDYV